MKKNIAIILLGVLLFPLPGCAPAAHVRVGIGLNAPVSWAGPYPYPGAAVTMGRPAGMNAQSIQNADKAKNTGIQGPTQKINIPNR